MLADKKLNNEVIQRSYRCELAGSKKRLVMSGKLILIISEQV
jgi:hypothetical protein